MHNIEKIQALHLRPGDRVAVYVPGNITTFDAQVIRAKVTKWLPKGVKAIILDRSMSLQVVRPQVTRHRTQTNPRFGFRLHYRKQFQRGRSLRRAAERLSNIKIK